MVLGILHRTLLSDPRFIYAVYTSSRFGISQCLESQRSAQLLYLKLAQCGEFLLKEYAKECHIESDINELASIRNIPDEGEEKFSLRLKMSH